MYSKFGQFIDGKWQSSTNKETYDVINPATEEIIGKASKASPVDVNKALNYLNKRSNNKLKSDFLDYKDLNWDLSFYGQGYGIQTKKSINAINLVAEKEAIFLDPIYTGKAMSGLIEYANSNKIDRDSSVVFIHSAGTPNLFTYSNELLSNL